MVAVVDRAILVYSTTNGKYTRSLCEDIHERAQPRSPSCGPRRKLPVVKNCSVLLPRFLRTWRSVSILRRGISISMARAKKQPMASRYPSCGYPTRSFTFAREPQKIELLIYAVYHSIFNVPYWRFSACPCAPVENPVDPQ